MHIISHKNAPLKKWVGRIYQRETDFWSVEQDEEEKKNVIYTFNGNPYHLLTNRDYPYFTIHSEPRIGKHHLGNLVDLKCLCTERKEVLVEKHCMVAFFYKREHVFDFAMKRFGRYIEERSFYNGEPNLWTQYELKVIDETYVYYSVSQVGQDRRLEDIIVPELREVDVNMQIERPPFIF